MTKKEKKFREKILKAAKFIDAGDPYKDVLDEYDVMDAIVYLAGYFDPKQRLKRSLK